MAKANPACVMALDDLRPILDRCGASGFIAFDLETTSLQIREAGIVGIALADRAGSYYVPVGHVDDGGSLLPGQPNVVDVLDLLAPVLVSRKVLKVGQNIKYDMGVLKRYGIEMEGVLDTMLLAYTMHAGKHRFGMDELSWKYLRHKAISFQTVTTVGGRRIDFSGVSIQDALAYAAEDAAVTLDLYDVFEQQHSMIVQDAGGATPTPYDVYQRIERPLIPVISRMEWAGIKVDVIELQRLSGVFGARCDELFSELMVLAGCDFNPGSPKQLADVLIGLGAIFTELTETGKPCTKESALEIMVADQDAPPAVVEIVAKLLEWRGLMKLRSTYTEALLASRDTATDRVHTSYMMAGTATGRLASSDPNLQNIPIRTPEGKLIRAAFIAEPGHRLVAADYSQIELRVLAHMADVPQLNKAFEDGIDIHTMTASEVLGKPVAEITSDERRSAKAVNFGIIYGSTAYGLARNLKIDVSEAEDLISCYFKRFPGIQDYMNATQANARRLGYVTTMYGRRINFPDIRSKHKGKRRHAERAAINAPIQGTAADIIKRGMIGVDRWIRFQAPRDVRLLLQVHDELVLEAPQAHVDRVKIEVKGIMECASILSVPLVVGVKDAANWLEAH